MKTLVIFLVLALTLIEWTLGLLNHRARKKNLPPRVAQVYDAKAYQTWLAYTDETHRLSTWAHLFSVALFLLALWFDLFHLLARWTEGLLGQTLIVTVAYLGILLMIQGAFRLPFRLYRVFSIEARYGFNRRTPKLFVSDLVKSMLLTASIGGGLLYGVLWIYLELGTAFLPLALGLLLSFSLVANVLYSKVFIRIFNKLTPLEEGPLMEAIKTLAQKTHYGVKAISVMDASKRSTRLNAFFSGFGRFRHIVLYDTLVEKCSQDQVLAVLAHEIGHAVHKDTWKNFLLSALQTAGLLGLLSFFLNSGLSLRDFGFESYHLGFSLLLFSLLTEPFLFLINIPLSAWSRRAEYRADAFAAENTNPGPMIQALKVLARENFSHLTPHPLVVATSYSHPPLNERIKAIEDMKKTGH